MLPKMLEHDRKQAGWSVGQAAWRLGQSLDRERPSSPEAVDVGAD
jgi:hypothetical protein